MITLAKILRDSDYRHAQFGLMQIHEFEQRIIVRTDNKGKEIPYISCLIRKKEIRLTPEEAVRQLYLEILLNDYKYPVHRIELEYAVTFGREKKRADIVIFDKDNTTAPYIIVEMKKPKLKDGKDQLKSYCNATGAPIGVWTNGDSISFYHRKDPN
ncbi:MAG: type I restriction enzyme HsdR N-terminal domain-containing protein, partial [Tannerella sp.]|nr:type I restriction enzyme HsdR N-terminal domain-containing protein [Tannerella sp.]